MAKPIWCALYLHWTFIGFLCISKFLKPNETLCRLVCTLKLPISCSIARTNGPVFSYPKKTTLSLLAVRRCKIFLPSFAFSKSLFGSFEPTKNATTVCFVKVAVKKEILCPFPSLRHYFKSKSLYLQKISKILPWRFSHIHARYFLKIWTRFHSECSK